MATLLIGIVVITLVVPLCVYIVGQFKAFSAAIQGMSNGQVPSWAASLSLAILLVTFEALGGLTVVALTDVIQGALLAAGACIMFAYVQTLHGGMLWGRLKRSARTVQAQCNYLGV